MLQGANFQNRSFMVMYAAGLSIAYIDFAIFGVAGVRVVENISGAKKVFFATFGVVKGVGDVQGPAIAA